MSQILLLIMAIFAVIGAFDRIIGNRLGLGIAFEEGIASMGSLALAMLGILCLAPALANILQPVVVPVFRFLGADPAIFAGSILACDMGGGALALQMADDPHAALFGGVLCGSMLGVTVVFTIPAAMGILREEDRPFLAKGVLAGVVTIPVGLLAGGLVAGMPFLKVLGNLTPIMLLAGLVALGLWRAEEAMIKGFIFFGKGVNTVITVGLAAGIFDGITGITLIPGLVPIEEGFLTVGAIAIVLAGAFPFVQVITRNPLQRLGSILGINESAAAGLVSSLANSITTLKLVKDMDKRGKVVNIAFAVSAAFVFGDHMGFTAGFAPDWLPAMIVSKLLGGLSAIIVALWLTKNDN